MKKTGFTLIELLIVIGILSILVVTILITLNPSEAQKKTRDTKRMKDLTTLQAIVQQWINDGKEPFCTQSCHDNNSSTPTACDNGWIKATNDSSASIDLCRYTNSLPLDPRGTESTYIYGPVSSPLTGTGGLHYQLQMVGSDYEINTRLESKSNIDKVANDGGDDNSWLEIGSCLKIIGSTSGC